MTLQALPALASEYARGQLAARFLEGISQLHAAPGGYTRGAVRSDAGHTVCTQPWHASAAAGPARSVNSAVRAPCTCLRRSYIAAGFVKWIESAGGRAVPIR